MLTVLLVRQVECTFEPSHHPIVRDVRIGHGDRCRSCRRTEFRFDADWSGTWSTAAVRAGECLVQVEVYGIEAHVPRSYFCHDRIQVGAIIVEFAACFVYDVADFKDVLLEESECVRVGQHNGCRVIPDQGIRQPLHLQGLYRVLNPER